MGPHPYTGNGITCGLSRTVPCPATVECYPGASCLQSGEKVQCGKCPEGHVGDGLMCRPKCRPPCNAHQRCSQPDTCQEDNLGQTRRPKKLGVRCRKRCSNGGRCSGLNRCSCPAGWRGSS